MFIKDLSAIGTQRLATSGIDSARLDAEILLAHALGVARFDLVLKQGEEIGDAKKNHYLSYIEKRAKNCPVAYITGIKEFWSIPIKVTPDVLIPRPETELVVEEALKFVLRDAYCVMRKTKHVMFNTNAIRTTHDARRILDLCTGSGCIAAALAKELPDAHLDVTDISERALDVARINLEFAKGHVNFYCGDLFSAVVNNVRTYERTNVPTYDIITANPPYIPEGDRPTLSRDITDYEPEAALYAGKSGLDFASRIIKDAWRYLKKGGILIMELGIGQANVLSAIAIGCKAYAAPEIKKDLAGIERVIVLRR